jgi:hypothetical protein
MSQTRRLAAILAADVAGYSRLMGADEEGTGASLPYKARTFGTPKSKTVLEWAMLQKTTAAAQPPGFGEFGGSAISFAFEGISGGEEGSSERQSGIGTARLFEPQRRLIDARLQQMRLTDSEIPNAKLGIARAEADCLLLGGDCLLYRANQEFASTDIGQCLHRVAIGRKRRLVFGNSFLTSPLRTQHLASGVMCERAAGRGCQGLPDQALCTCYVCLGRVGQSVIRSQEGPAVRILFPPPASPLRTWADHRARASRSPMHKWIAAVPGGSPSSASFDELVGAGEQPCCASSQQRPSRSAHPTPIPVTLRRLGRHHPDRHQDVLLSTPELGSRRPFDIRLMSTLWRRATIDTDDPGPASSPRSVASMPPATVDAWPSYPARRILLPYICLFNLYICETLDRLTPPNTSFPTSEIEKVPPLLPKSAN